MINDSATPTDFDGRASQCKASCGQSRIPAATFSPSASTGIGQRIPPALSRANWQESGIFRHMLSPGTGNVYAGCTPNPHNRKVINTCSGRHSNATQPAGNRLSHGTIASPRASLMPDQACLRAQRRPVLAPAISVKIAPVTPSEKVSAQTFSSKKQQVSAAPSQANRNVAHKRACTATSLSPPCATNSP